MTGHAVIALRKRREETGGQVHEAEKQVTKLWAAVANRDATSVMAAKDVPESAHAAVTKRCAGPCLGAWEPVSTIESG